MSDISVSVTVEEVVKVAVTLLDQEISVKVTVNPGTGGTGTSDHAALTNLAYNNANHTGFEAAGAAAAAVAAHLSAFAHADIAHTNRSVLNSIQEALTTALKNAYDACVTWISNNGANILAHIGIVAGNPHGTSYGDVGAAAAVHTHTDKVDKAVASTTGTAIVFTEDKTYGSITTPETGNITANLTGALNGVVVEVIHQNATEPTYPGTFQKLSGSQAYNAAKVNHIFFQYKDATHQKYLITYDA